jgi:hypothetical protein
LRFHLRRREEAQGGWGEICEGLGGTFAVISVAIMIAVEEPGSDFSKIGCRDRLTAQHTRGLLGGLPVIHQYELHVASPGATRNAASDEWEDIRWESTEVISAVGSSFSTRPFPVESEMYFPTSQGWSRLRSISLAVILDTLSPAFGFSE